MPIENLHLYCKDLPTAKLTRETRIGPSTSVIGLQDRGGGYKKDGPKNELISSKKIILDMAG